MQSESIKDTQNKREFISFRINEKQILKFQNSDKK